MVWKYQKSEIFGNSSSKKAFGGLKMVLIDFTGKVARSFKVMKKEVTELKQSLNEWILFLNSNQRDLKQRLYELEKKVRMLEAETKKVYR